jgi:hypothetical protein
LRPPFNGSIPAFLGSYAYLNEEKAYPVEEFHKLESHAIMEAKKRIRIANLRRAGAFDNIEDKPPVNIEPQEEPKRPPNHRDYLVSHTLVMSKYVKEEGKARVVGAKRIARMIEKYFEHVAGAETRVQKTEERRIIMLARSTLKMVVNEWRLAVSVSYLITLTWVF